MRDFFSIDGPFNKYGGMLADAMILSFLWILFSLPIITIGAANTALFYVTTRRIAEREGYITSDFWHAFKVNFVRATKFWLLILLVIFVTGFNIITMWFGTFGGNMATFLLPMQLLILIQLSFISVYLYPMIARFDMGFKQTLKSSFYMANRHMLTSFSCVVLVGGMIFLSIWYNFAILLLLIPGAYAMVSSHMIMRVFKKYRPEMVRDPFLEAQEIEAQITEERRLRSISGVSEETNKFEEANENGHVKEEFQNDNELQ